MSLSLPSHQPGRWAACLAFVLVVGCSSSSDTPAPDAGGAGGVGGVGGSTGGAGGGASTDAAGDLSDDTGDAAVGAGGPVAGPVDDHCGTTVQVTTAAVCHYTAPADAGMEPEETPELRFNSSSDDDDCKYHVNFSTTTPVAKNTDMFITVTAIRKEDGKPATMAAPEVYLTTADDKHIAPDTTPTATEGPDGTYKIGPVKFDVSGRWKLLFHFYELCSDLPKNSQHGHASFWFDVP